MRVTRGIQKAIYGRSRSKRRQSIFIAIEPPVAIPFSSVGYIDEEGYKIPFAETIAAPQETEPNIASTLDSKIWKHILPGIERTCVALRAQDYTYSEIAFIVGKNINFVINLISTIKNRLLRLGIKDFKNLL